MRPPLTRYPKSLSTAASYVSLFPFNFFAAVESAQFLFLFLRLVGLAGAAENVAHRVVAFMARVFVDRTLGRYKGILNRPILGKRAGIVDGHLVENGVLIDARKPLDHVQIGGR